MRIAITIDIRSEKEEMKNLRNNFICESKEIQESKESNESKESKEPKESKQSKNQHKRQFNELKLIKHPEMFIESYAQKSKYSKDTQIKKI
ncbi:hypothetical protein pb186bvf_012917 [Paramecium bursaria]